MRINVTRSSLPSFEEYCQEIRPLWDSHWLTNNGEKHEALETALAAYWQCPHVELFTNGHLALEAVLAALHLPAGGEIITTPFSFASTTHAIVRKGFAPVFCDVLEDGTLDAGKLEVLITPRTCAIVPVHVYGRLCDVDAIAAIADKHGLPVVYDAAHAFGVSRNGIPSAAFGLASMFSFHATKVFNTIEGGAVATRDNSLAEALRLERNYGITGPDDVVSVGGNAKMNEFQAAMGLCNLRHVAENIAQRKRVHDSYMAHLGHVEGIALPKPQPGITSNYAYFPVVFEGRETRNAVCEALRQQGIYARKYFYPLIPDFACYAHLPPADVPVARRLSDGVVTLPLYPELAEEDIALICQILCEVLRNG